MISKCTHTAAYKEQISIFSRAQEEFFAVSQKKEEAKHSGVSRGESVR